MILPTSLLPSLLFLAQAPFERAPDDVLLGSQTNNTFGAAVACAGDVNGDGFSDVIVGAPGFAADVPGQGRVELYLGSQDGIVPVAAWTAIGSHMGSQPGWRFGAAVDGAGDVNGDGYDDVVIGAPKGGLSGRGRVYVYLGAEAGLSDSPLVFDSFDPQPPTEFGASVAGCGDLNADGLSDFAVGIPFADVGCGHGFCPDSGQVSFYLGQPSGLPTPWGGMASYTVAGGAGDVDADGGCDMLQGGPLYNSVFVELSALPYRTTQLTAQSFGSAQALAGDVNGDGFCDLFVGAPGYMGGQASEGRAVLYLGASAGVPDTASWSVESDQIDARFGASVAGAGDVDGDGLADVLASAPRVQDSTGSRVGAVGLFYGRPRAPGLRTRLLCIQQLRVQSDAPIALYGRSDASDGFRLRVSASFDLPKTRRSGATLAWLEWEARPLGQPFDPAGIQRGSAQRIGLGEHVFVELVKALAPDTAHAWRARVVTDHPLVRPTPWFSLSGNTQRETKLRTAP